MKVNNHSLSAELVRYSEFVKIIECFWFHSISGDKFSLHLAFNKEPKVLLQLCIYLVQ